MSFQSGPNVDCPKQPESDGRRQFLKAAGATVAAAGIGNTAAAAIQKSDVVRNAPKTAPDSAPAGYNILFILTDQEKYFDAWPFPVPGRESMRRDGITFTHHQIASCVCSPSRSTIYTGQHTQHTGVLDSRRTLATRYAIRHSHDRTYDARRGLPRRIPRKVASQCKAP
ncbi:twin-arginine translocation signal domain-containing protein [Paraburkholderia xenovorans]